MKSARSLWILAILSCPLNAEMGKVAAERVAMAASVSMMMLSGEDIVKRW